MIFRRALQAGIILALGVTASQAIADDLYLPRGALAQDALAEADDPTIYPVGERPLEDYDARGIRWRSLLFYPSLTAWGEYDDNVFATEEKQEDWVFRIEPELLVKSDWSRHYFQFRTGADAAFFKNYSSDNHVDYFADAAGRVDIFSNLNVVGQLSYSRETEERGEGESFTSFDEPVEYDRLFGSGSVNGRVNRLYGSLGFSVENKDFHDTTYNDVVIDQDARDYTQPRVYARAGYELTPMTSVFGEVAVDKKEFSDSDLDSVGTRTIVGLAFEASRLINGEIYAGYMTRSFDDGGLDDVSTYTFGGALSYQPTRLVTLNFTGRREAEESTYLGGVSKVETEVGVSADYELRRNIILSALASYEWDDYEDDVRADEYLRLGASARYLLNRSFSVGVNYRYTDFDSDAVPDYDRNVVSVFGRVQY